MLFRVPLVHHPKPPTHPPPQPNKPRQQHIRFKPQVERQQAHPFERAEAAAQDVEDRQVEAPLEAVPHPVGEAQDVPGQDAFQHLGLFAQPFQAAEPLVVLLVEARPLAEGIVVGLVGDAQAILPDFEVRDGSIVVPPGEMEAPVGLHEEVLRLVDALVDEDDGRLAALPLVLYQGVAVVVSHLRRGVVVVVVEQLVLQPHLLNHRPPEGRRFVGGDLGVEGDAEYADFLHMY